MICPFCDHPKIIVNQSAPIGGEIYDETTGKSTPRLRCEKCGRPIRMEEIQPSRPPKGKVLR